MAKTRVHRPGWLSRTLIGLVAAMSLTACAIVDPRPAIPLRTQDPPGDGLQACMAALATGTLVTHPTSGMALRAPEGNVVEVIWPFGYAARFEAGRATLLDDRGNVIAREGEQVAVGGGEAQPGIWFACGGVAPLEP